MGIWLVALGLLTFVSAQYGAPYGYAAPQHYESAYDQPLPYSFGFEARDDYGGIHTRQEQDDGYGNKKGSYSYTDGYGVYRQVDYVADKDGFRASVKTNEPGTDNQNPADVQVHSEAAPVKYDAPRPYAPAYRPAPAYKPYAPAPAYTVPAPSYQPQPYSGPYDSYKPY